MTTLASMLCHCELSGEIHVVTAATCCEICSTSNLVPITPMTVEAALTVTRGKHAKTQAPAAQAIDNDAVRVRIDEGRADAMAEGEATARPEPEQAAKP